MQIDIEKIIREAVQAEIKRLASQAIATSRPKKAGPPATGDHGGPQLTLGHQHGGGPEVYYSEDELTSRGMVKVSNASKSFGVSGHVIRERFKSGRIGGCYAIGKNNNTRTLYIMPEDVAAIRDESMKAAEAKGATGAKDAVAGLELASDISARTGVPHNSINNAAKSGQFDGSVCVAYNTGGQVAYYHDAAKVIAGMEIVTRYNPAQHSALVDSSSAAAICSTTPSRFLRAAQDGGISPVVMYRIGTQRRALYCPEEVRKWHRRLKRPQM